MYSLAWMFIHYIIVPYVCIEANAPVRTINFNDASKSLKKLFEVISLDGYDPTFAFSRHKILRFRSRINNSVRF
jgi:hypothetical protein